jgi:hypothetical protein
MTASLVTTGYHVPKKFPESPGVLLGERPSNEVILATPDDFKRMLKERKKNRVRSGDHVG